MFPPGSGWQPPPPIHTHVPQNRGPSAAEIKARLERDERIAAARWRGEEPDPKDLASQQADRIVGWFVLMVIGFIVLSVAIRG